jgi:hypothetical protein
MSGESGAKDFAELRTDLLDAEVVDPSQGKT